MQNEPNTVDALARIIHSNQSNLVQSKFVTGRPVRPFSLVPDGYTIEHHEEAPLPDHPRGAASFNDAASYAHYVNQFKAPATLQMLTASDMFQAVFDYHGKDAAGKPFHGTLAHSAMYQLTKSPEWKFWTGLHDKWMSQAQVIELLEEHRGDIVAPSAADIIRVAEDFKSSSAAEYVTRYNRVTQSTQLIAKEEENMRGAAEIIPPADILLSIPVFERGTKVDIQGLFSWAGKPDKFAKVRFINMPDALESARATERTEVQALTNIRVLLGSV